MLAARSSREVEIEKDAAVEHQLQCRVVEERPVLDASTAGQDHLARRVSRVEVHHGFAADCPHRGYSRWRRSGSRRRLQL